MRYEAYPGLQTAQDKEGQEETGHWLCRWNEEASSSGVPPAGEATGGLFLGRTMCCLATAAQEQLSSAQPL
eukprot:3937960-Amphidinium_carterae.1